MDAKHDPDEEEGSNEKNSVDELQHGTIEWRPFYEPVEVQENGTDFIQQKHGSVVVEERLCG